MINGLEGIPGSGKSYECVVYQVLPLLAKGRMVITNLPLLIPMFAAIDPAYEDLIEVRIRPAPIRGTWDASRVDEKGNGNAFVLFEDGHTVDPALEVSVFGHVWDYYTHWKHPVTGQGPAYFIDECHVSLPSPPGGVTDRAVVEWYKLHRHFNADVVLMTQSFRDINQPIARLIAMMVKVRKADILGKPDEYIRKVHAGYRGAVISTEQRKYKPEFFPLYKSHTQGNSVAEASASDVAPLSVKLRRATRIMWFICAVACAAFLVYANRERTPGVSKKRASVDNAVGVFPPGSVLAPGQQIPPPLSHAPAAPAASASAPVQPVVDLEPLKDKLVHITGWLGRAKQPVYTFTVSAGGIRQFDIVSADLVASGYTWQPLGECMGYLRWQEKVRTITCDAPRLSSGSDQQPVVVDLNSGKRSDDKVSPGTATPAAAGSHTSMGNGAGYGLLDRKSSSAPGKVG